MAKRTATTDINHDNWDAPDEEEEAGTFKIASTDALQKRVIKTAKRRIAPTENTDGSKSIFSTFAGFKSNTSSGNSGSSKPSFEFLSSIVTTSSAMPTTTTNGSVSTASTNKSDVTPQQKYLASLQTLNRSVTDWIKTHVDSNPVCILTPVFKDYEKYLKEIQDERDSDQKSASNIVSSSPGSLSSFSFVNSSSGKGEIKFPLSTTTAAESTKKTFTFTDAKANTAESDLSKPNPLLFGLPVGTGKSPLSQDNENKPAKPSIFSTFKGESAGSALLKKPDPASLMVNPFTAALNKEKAEVKPSMSSNKSTAESSSKKDEEEDEESDEPPKVEFTPIQEEGAVFSTRCKVFVKKDSNYKDRGVGNLFIKKVGEDKHQLLVRAENALGTILLNVLLSSGVPTKRMGKNNVMLVCLPTPQDPPPPTTVLLRVKTAEEADDLLKTIEKYIN